MLEGVVEEDDLRWSGESEQTLHAFHAVFVNGDLDVAELAEVLHRLVADVGGSAVFVGQSPALFGAAVATAEGGYAVVGREQPDEVFGEGRLARAAKAEVAHADDGRIETRGAQEVPVVELVPDKQHEVVKQRYGQQQSSHKDYKITSFF